MLLFAAACGFSFVAIYIVLQTDTQLLGLAMGITLALLAAAAIIAGKLVVPQETSVESRGPLLEQTPAEEVIEIIQAGGEGADPGQHGTEPQAFQDRGRTGTHTK